MKYEKVGNLNFYSIKIFIYNVFSYEVLKLNFFGGLITPRRHS